MDRKVIVTFVKRTNLMEFRRHIPTSDSVVPESYYSKEQDVRLVVTERITAGQRIFVRISCPINPLPVKGEFEIPSWGALKQFLEANGWKQHEVIDSRFLQDTNLLGREMNDWDSRREELYKGND